MYNLETFSLRCMTLCGAALRGLGEGGRSMEDVAGRLVTHMHEGFINQETSRRSFVLVRFFKTILFRDLEPDLQRKVADDAVGGPPAAGMRCLTLLATAGEQPEWNDRTASVNHRVIPLSSRKILSELPMLSQLIKQFGFETGALLEPDPGLLMDLHQNTFNVFHVPVARDSPYVPDQEGFVARHGVRSVLGFGGILPPGNLFAIIVFSRDPISRETADLFKPLALSAKIAVLPHAGGRTFS